MHATPQVASFSSYTYSMGWFSTTTNLRHRFRLRWLPRPEFLLDPVIAVEFHRPEYVSPLLFLFLDRAS